jgi:5-methylcytosine-specific restriction endonuclease McrA
VLDRFSHSCIGCGRHAGDVVLHVDHIIPIELAKRHGLYEPELIESEWNMGPQCEECNLGKGAEVFSARTVALMYRGLVMAAKAGVTTE